MNGVITLAEREIHIGHHVRYELFGMGFNLDTVISTLLAGGLVLILGFVARNYLTRDPEDHVPSKMQLLWETIVEQVNKQVVDNLGKVHPYVAPLAISLFFFILFANWLELMPTKLNNDTHLTPAPTADTNLTYALGAITIVSVWVYGVRQMGLGGFFKHLIPEEMFPNKAIDYPVRFFFTLLHILEELVKPITLALRLFGNIFAGGIMLSLIAMLATLPFKLGWVMLPAANIAWKAFDMVIGVIQAFIFALLTVLYFSMVQGHGHDDDHDDAHTDQQADEQASKDSAPAHA
ncbi:MAG: F0F1 ATP synthase subunit A [Nocardioides sp.]